jgi:hypothetical protein
MLNTANVSIDEVLKGIDDNSYYLIEDAVPGAMIDKIEKELHLWEFPLNENDIHAVAVRHGAYFSHALAKSPTLFQLMTDPFILKLSRSRLGEDFRMKCHRVYSVYPGFDQPWHTDNKAHGIKEGGLEGLVFITYFKDVNDGELQILRGSHKWNDRYSYSIFDEDVVNERYPDLITGFKRPRGSMIVYDAKAVHRASPIKDKRWHRTSLFFQVDNYSGDGEKILLDAAFLKDLTPELCQFLGFGKPSTYPTAPSATSLQTFLPNQLLEIQKSLLAAFASTSMRGAIDMIPRSFRHRLQHWFGKQVAWNTTFNTKGE